jgi:D-alanine-D-alanine ligase
MKVAFTHNLRLTNSEEEAEFDSVETVAAIAKAIKAAGHEVEKIEVSGPATNLLERLEAIDPDIIFNTAEGRGGRMREAFYPALFEELGVPYTGSDAYTMALTLDKWLTKLVATRAGVDTPRSELVTSDSLTGVLESGLGLAYPVIVKPNHDGSSKGIADDSVANDALVIPKSRLLAVAGSPPAFSTRTFSALNKYLGTCWSNKKSVSPGSTTFTNRIICRTITSICLSLMVTPWDR